jgi:hypothetical protein
MKLVGMLILFIVLIALALGCDQDVLDVARFDQPLPGEAPAIDEVVQATAYANGAWRTDRVSLEWTEATSSSFLAYQILRRPTAATTAFQIVGSVNDRAVTAFTDSNLANNNGDVEYSYVVATMLNSGTATMDTVDVKTPMWDMPSNVQVNVRDVDTCRLTWTDNCESEDGFLIYEYDSDFSATDPKDSTEVDADVTEYSFSNLDNTNSFSIVAFNDFEDPTPETMRYWFTNDFGAPNNISFYQPQGTQDLMLTWNDNSNIETEYQIEREVNGGGWVARPALPYNTTEYLDEDLNVGDTYRYRIRGYNEPQDIATFWTTTWSVTVADFEFYTSFEDGDIPNDLDQGGDADWMVVMNEDDEDDAYVLKAGDITHEESTSIEWATGDLTGGHTIEFNFKVSSESSNDWLTFYIDDVMVERWSGEWGWNYRNYFVSSGEHVLRWTYEKNDYDYNIDSDDTAWIDNINMW